MNTSSRIIDGGYIYHGNWCGPGWTGGSGGSYGDLRNNNQRGFPAKSPLDAGCKGHDICYQLCRDNFPCDKQGRINCMRLCDRALALSSAKSGNYGGLFGWMLLNRFQRFQAGENEPFCNECE